MINKLLLHNQFVAHKKKFQQAKICVIRKLVQKIRNIESAIQKKPENIRLKTKIERTQKILACVKKVKCVDIFKKSLLNEKNPSSILTNGNSTDQATAEALLFQQKFISEITEQLKELHYLNDTANPGWRDELLELSKRAQKRKKTSSDSSGSKDARKLKKLNKWVENTFLARNENSKQSYDQSAPAGWKVNEIPTEPVGNAKILERDDSEKQISINRKPNKIVKNNTESSIYEKELTHVVDPFFVTNTGDNYLSTVVISRVQTNIPDDGLVRKERRAANSGYVKQTNKVNKSDTFQEGNNRNTKQRNEQVTSVSKEFHPSWVAKQKQKGIPEFHGKKTIFSDDIDANPVKEIKCKSLSDKKDNEKLHPSWEAKQKLKPVITEFKGKRIVFDED